ncbi:hypothetical protein KSS87_021980, partial [Heliosperma pusillum]
LLFRTICEQLPFIFFWLSTTFHFFFLQKTTKNLLPARKTQLSGIDLPFSPFFRHITHICSLLLLVGLSH